MLRAMSRQKMTFLVFKFSPDEVDGCDGRLVIIIITLLDALSKYL